MADTEKLESEVRRLGFVKIQFQYFTKWRLMADDLSGYPLAVRAGFPRPAIRWDKADGRGDRALTPVRYIA